MTQQQPQQPIEAIRFNCLDKALSFQANRTTLAEEVVKTAKIFEDFVRKGEVPS